MSHGGEGNATETQLEEDAAGEEEGTLPRRIKPDVDIPGHVFFFFPSKYKARFNLEKVPV